MPPSVYNGLSLLLSYHSTHGVSMRFAIYFLLSVSVAGPSVQADETTKDSHNVEKLFVGKILPLLKQKCFACHGEDPKGELKGDLDLRTRQAMLKGGESGDPSLVAGKPAESLLYQAILWDGYEMPPKENDRLNESEIAYFKQ